MRSIHYKQLIFHLKSLNFFKLDDSTFIKVTSCISNILPNSTTKNIFSCTQKHLSKHAIQYRTHSSHRCVTLLPFLRKNKPHFQSREQTLSQATAGHDNLHTFTSHVLCSVQWVPCESSSPYWVFIREV